MVCHPTSCFKRYVISDISARASAMIFVDTWAWVALVLRRDQYHQAATVEHRRLLQARRG